MTKEEAIKIIEQLLIEHRQTHVTWRDYFLRCPSASAVFEDGSGNLQDQKDAIAAYDKALEAVDVLRGEVESENG